MFLKYSFEEQKFLILMSSNLSFSFLTMVYKKYLLQG